MPVPSPQDLYEMARAEILRLRPDLLGLPGDIVDLVISSGVAMSDLILGYNEQRIAETFLDGAEGDALTKRVRDRYGLERRVAAQSVGSVSFTHVAGPTGTILAGTRVATTPDASGAFVIATTDTNLVFGGADATKSVAATAQQGGRAGNVPAGAFNRVLDQPSFDTSFTVTNAALFAGGNEAESDPELREQARSFAATLRRATLAAIAFGAKQVPTIRTVSVFEDPDSLLTTAHVADADGDSNAQMVNDAIIELEEWRAAGAAIQVAGGTAIDQAISIALTVRAGVSIPTLVDRVQAAIVSAVNRLQQGETLYRSLIQSAGRAVDPDNLLELDVLVPAANVVPLVNQAIRTSTGLVTVA